MWSFTAQLVDEIKISADDLALQAAALGCLMTRRSQKRKQFLRLRATGGSSWEIPIRAFRKQPVYLALCLQPCAKTGTFHLWKGDINRHRNELHVIFRAALSLKHTATRFFCSHAGADFLPPLMGALAGIMERRCRHQKAPPGSRARSGF